MSKLRNLIVLLIVVLSVDVFAQRQNEFAGIPFGSSRETVIEEVMKLGYDTYDQGGHVQIPVYKFGELPVQVDFIFNQNDKFYAFEIRTGRVEEARRSKTIEAAEYMSEQFTVKYGKSSGDPTLTEMTIRDGRNIYEQWFSVKTLDIQTQIIKRENRYFVMGVVQHRTLAKEGAAVKKTKEKKKTEPVF